MHKKFYISLFVSLSLVLCLAQTSYAYNIGKVPNPNKLPLIETALGGDALPGQMYVVPAIFLKYNHDKIRNDYIEKGIVTTLDVATIALSGGTALATKVHWVRRAWALAEVAGAVGNIAVNTQAISSPRVKEAVDIYNAAMGLIGLKNIGQGGYKFIKNLPEQTKKLLQKSERLREGLQQGYLKWKALAKNLDNLTDAEKQLITEQEQVWRVLGMLDDAASVGRYSLANISKERGFIDLLPDLLKKEGLTMDDFHYMMQKNVNALTEAEKAQLARIRNAMPKPDANTVMQKVIPKTDIENYINPTSNNYKQIGGYVSTAADTKHLKTFEDLYYGERLDYTNSKFFTSANSCGVIRFKNTRSSEVVIPTGPQYNGYDYPFTAHGFTSGSNGRLGVPEWHFQSRIDIQEGTEIWEIFNDGTEELRAIYRSGKFVIIR